MGFEGCRHPACWVPLDEARQREKEKEVTNKKGLQRRLDTTGGSTGRGGEGGAAGEGGRTESLWCREAEGAGRHRWWLFYRTQALCVCRNLQTDAEV